MRQLEQEGLLAAAGGRLSVRRLGPKEIADILFGGTDRAVVTMDVDRHDAIVEASKLGNPYALFKPPCRTT